MTGLRNLTSSDSCSSDFLHVRDELFQPVMLAKIVNVIKSSVSKFDIPDVTKRAKKVKILCEAIWTLSNLVAEGGNDTQELLFLYLNIV